MHEIELFQIPEYPDYKISRLGEVYSFKSGKKRVLRPSLVNGYHQLILRKENKRKSFFVHQLMALTFLGHVIKGHEQVVDHINSIKTDNRLENLRIISNRENVSIGKYKERGLPTGVSVLTIKGNLRNYTYFRAQIYLEEQTHLGIFSSAEEASEAYQEALKNLEKNKTNSNV